MNKDKVIIFIPNEKNYIEILGHRLDFNGGWEEFLEYLKQLELNKQRIDKAIEYIKTNGENYEYFNISKGTQETLLEILRGNNDK